MTRVGRAFGISARQIHDFKSPYSDDAKRHIYVPAISQYITGSCYKLQVSSSVSSQLPYPIVLCELIRCLDSDLQLNSASGHILLLMQKIYQFEFVLQVEEKNSKSRSKFGE